MSNYIINNKYYIIRTGDFATNGNKKMLYSLFGALLCLDDYYTNNSCDCFSIMIGSSISWAIIELLLHISNTRKIKPMFISYPLIRENFSYLWRTHLFYTIYFLFTWL